MRGPLEGVPSIGKTAQRKRTVEWNSRGTWRDGQAEPDTRKINRRLRLPGAMKEGRSSLTFRGTTDSGSKIN